MIKGVGASVAQINAGYKKEEEKSLNQVRSKDVEEIVTQNKAAQIKESIDNKDYRIDLKRTSEKMALDLLNL